MHLILLSHTQELNLLGDVAAMRPTCSKMLTPVNSTCHMVVTISEFSSKVVSMPSGMSTNGTTTQSGNRGSAAGEEPMLER